jgi:transcriptional regulator with XRE-family HTH domain
MTLPERIAYFRKRAGLTQRELALLCDVDQSAPGHWERPNGPVPRNLEGVVEKLGVSMVEFYSATGADAEAA